MIDTSVQANVTQRKFVLRSCKYYPKYKIQTLECNKSTNFPIIVLYL